MTHRDHQLPQFVATDSLHNILVKTYPSSPLYGRSTLVLAILLFSIALVLTIILIEPSSAQKQISSEDAADFVGYLGNVCGRVTSVSQDSQDRFAALNFGDSKDPSFVTFISIRGSNLQRKYAGKDVCVGGRITNEVGEPEGIPSIMVADESQLSIE